MPKIAALALTQRLHDSGLLDQLKKDVRILFRKQLKFFTFQETAPENWILVPLAVGAVQLGHLALIASEREERNAAYRNWLSMAAKFFESELINPQNHTIGAVPSKVNRAAHIIQVRHTEALSLGELAAEVGLSRERLSRLFHQSLGISFSEYLTQTRIATARNLLRESDLPIIDVAYDSGFQSLSQFNRSFAKLENCSPSQFRRITRSPRAKSRVL